MYVFGLTGLIGSGKTTVANIFAKFGISIVDTDIIAHQITSDNGAAIPAIINVFGSEYVTVEKSLDRDRMRGLVFNDSAARSKLENILHPIIFDEVIKQLAQVESANYSIVVVPLLFKSPRYLQMTHRNIFVDCDYDSIVIRLKTRNNFSKLQIDAILATQVSREKQMSLADDIIYNNGEISLLEQQVNILHEKYLQLK